jgi:hypothetical protein
MIFNERRLKTLIGEASDRTGQTVKAISARMGEPDKGNYLARKLNPDDDGAHLSPVDLVLFFATTDLVALDYIESVLGRVAFALPNVQAGSELVAAAKAGKAAERFGIWMQRIAQAMSPDGDGGTEITPAEVAELIQEGNEIIRIFIKFKSYLMNIKRPESA